MEETFDNIIIQIFMQAGNNLILEGPFVRKEITPGYIWPIGGLSKTVVHWTYKPLDGANLIDSIKLHFQKNEHSFCQWFALLAYFADRDDEFAKECFVKMIPFRNIYNATLLIDFVQGSQQPLIVAMRKDLVWMPNASIFWNHGKNKVHYIGVDKMYKLFKVNARLNDYAMDAAKNFVSEGLFFALLKKALHELGDWP